MTVDWYRTAYRRNVIDMHITDWDERFLSQFDARNYVDMLRLSGAQSAVVYAHSHVGHCYYPTQVGHTHAGIKGRNILGEVIDQCHANDIAVVVYYSLIYDDYAYRQHREWRVIVANGQDAAEHSRYGVCCPNSPYRDYARAHAEEICRLFEFEGLRFDMTFWPAVCYCSHCQQRFAQEVGGELPRTIHWDDPQWVAFQRRRETWLSEFGAYMTAAVKACRADITVEHQASTYPLNWRFGVTTSLAPANDFLQGDFYGDALQGSFVRKLFSNLSPKQPYGFETSSAVSLQNHTATKPEALLRAKAFSCLADGGAFVFIDAIDPVGTLNRAVYERMGRVFAETRAYEPYVGGRMAQDVGIYLSTESKHDPADNGKAVDDAHLSNRVPHVEALVSVCKALIENHIPYGVISKRNLGDDLGRYQALILPKVLMLDEREMAALREYVRAGGALYASGKASLVTTDGRRHADFCLGDLFGVSYMGETAESFTYIAPANGAESLFAGYSARYPLGLPSPQAVVRALPGARILGHTVLPYTNPSDPRRYASIHSNPPGVATDSPAVVLNNYGQGRVIYVTTDLESYDIHHETLVSLVRLLAQPFSFEASAPKSVEVTLFHQPEKKRLVVSLINFQKELPNIPVDGAIVRVRFDNRRVRELALLPERKAWPYEINCGYVELMAPKFETFCMFALDYL
jgi:hypothetical protein